MSRGFHTPICLRSNPTQAPFRELQNPASVDGAPGLVASALVARAKSDIHERGGLPCVQQKLLVDGPSRANKPM